MPLKHFKRKKKPVFVKETKKFDEIDVTDIVALGEKLDKLGINVNFPQKPIPRKETPMLRPWAPTKFADRNLKSWFAADGSYAFIGLEDEERVCKLADLDWISELTRQPHRAIPRGTFAAVFCTPLGFIHESDRGIAMATRCETGVWRAGYRRITSRVQALIKMDGHRAELLALGLLPALKGEEDSLTDEEHQDAFYRWFNETCAIFHFDYVKQTEETPTVNMSKIITRDGMLSGSMATDDNVNFYSQHFLKLQSFGFQRGPPYLEERPSLKPALYFRQYFMIFLFQKVIKAFPRATIEDLKQKVIHLHMKLEPIHAREIEKNSRRPLPRSTWLPPHLPPPPQPVPAVLHPLPHVEKEHPMEQILMATFCDKVPVLNTAYLVNGEHAFTKSFHLETKSLLPRMCDDCKRVLRKGVRIQGITKRLIHRKPQEPLTYESPDDGYTLDHPSSSGNPHFLFRFALFRVNQETRHARIRTLLPQVWFAMEARNPIPIEQRKPAIDRESRKLEYESIALLIIKAIDGKYKEVEAEGTRHFMVRPQWLIKEEEDAMDEHIATWVSASEQAMSAGMGGYMLEFLKPSALFNVISYIIDAIDLPPPVAL